MHNIDLTEFKTKLIAQRDTLIEELGTIAVHRTDTDDWEAIPASDEPDSADENVEADGVESWNERRATVATLERRYHNIVRALAKIEGGTYGICEISGQTIEVDRLTANPAARTCKAHLNDEETLRY